MGKGTGKLSGVGNVLCPGGLYTCVYIYIWTQLYGFPRWLSGKETTCQWRRHKRRGFDPWVGKIPWSRKWQPAPVFLPGKFHRQRSLVGYIQSTGSQRAMSIHIHHIK